MKQLEKETVKCIVKPELLYVEEHLGCFHYSKENALIKVKKIKKGETFDYRSSENCIIFLLKGRISFSFGINDEKLLEKGQFMIHPARTNILNHVLEDGVIVTMRLLTNLSFCDHFTFEDFYDESNEDNKPDLNYLEMNVILKDFLNSLARYWNDGLRCTYFLELKVREFLYILRAYYPKEQLKIFFKPILNKDFQFSEQVFQHYQQAKSAKELAEMMNYSFSGFHKRFKRVFGVSVNKWMQHEMARNIYHEIKCSTKTFGEIGFEFGFTSPSHFNDFCKRIFHETPGTIRKGKKCSV